jgi:hypothetical protein
MKQTNTIAKNQGGDLKLPLMPPLTRRFLS